MGKLKDLKGQMFGRLKVIERSDNIEKEVAWLCECQCENKTKLVVKTRYLIHKYKSSCGCIRQEIEDLTCRTFNNWTVISYVGKNKSRNSLWLCRCSCGNDKMSIVPDNNLKNGSSMSCGCLNKRNTKHDKSRNGSKLDLKIFNAWSSMKDRCFNKNNRSYNHYGGRGITICDEWLDVDMGFMNFYEWSIINRVEENLSIDRIDVNGNYEPFNCRWVDFFVQNNNKTDNKIINYKGEDKTLTMWAREFNIHPMTLRDRLKRGWDVERSLNEEVKHEYRKIK